MKKLKLQYVAAAAIITALVTVGALAAGGVDDPLVTLSYLNQVFTPTVTAHVDEAVKANEETLISNLNNAITQWNERLQQNGQAPGIVGDTPNSNTTQEATFALAELSLGQTLTCNTGCELVIRDGTALFSNGSGLIDSTTGTPIASGKSLEVNHLYIVVGESASITPSGTVNFLARGNFTIT